MDPLIKLLEEDSKILREEFLKGKLAKMHLRIKKAVPRLQKEGVPVGELKRIASKIARTYSKEFNGKNRRAVRRAIKISSIRAAQLQYGREKSEPNFLIKMIGGVIEAFVLLMIVLSLASRFAV